MNTMNTLIADSGSTKTDWAIGAIRLKTQGINPVLQDDETILSILRNELLPSLTSHPSLLTSHLSIRFYGSGVRSDQEERMRRLLGTVFPAAKDIVAKSDMMGAAIALLGRQEGQACILGTGSNSCLFDGQRIVQNIPPLGYVLGDEGGGASLGKLFLNALYKKRLYEGAQEEFERCFGLSMSDVIDRVYRQPMANRWLASLSEYIHQHLCHPSVNDLVVQNFRNFIRCNILPYQRPDLPLSAVGSIAWFYRQQLALAAQDEGYVLGRILRSPIEGLADMWG